MIDARRLQLIGSLFKYNTVVEFCDCNTHTVDLWKYPGRPRALFNV
jgi:hypothetical protein